MSELVGQTLGHYRIVEKIGAGGMGEVYRARDKRLDRDVAIKVLHQRVAQDTERLARFEREAKLLASLSHQNIATLYGLDEHDGVRFLAMELAEGATLADRIARGPLPVEDSLAIALQVASGLEAAHERGVIHRDLKPANVMVSPEGQVKILDFGLAKMWVDELSDVDLTHSPTITAEMTASGVLLGTAAYMSPEQARGKRVDKRTDIWSFGVVLYEMLTGLRPFSAQTAGETIGNVLHKGIDFQRLPPLPLNIRRALRRCLERKLERRYRDIGDVRIELEPSGDDESPVEPVVHKPRRPWLRTAIVSVLLAGAAFLGWTIRGYKTATSIPLLEADISLPAGHRLSAFSQPSFSLSPDGQRMVFFAGPEPDDWWWDTSPQPTQLLLRRLEQDQAVPVAGVGSGTSAVFSPDGQWIAYLQDALYKVPVSGGQRVKINTDGNLNRNTVIGLSWGGSGDLVLGTRNGGLQRVSAQGGPPTALTELDDELGEFRHCLPAHLPDGRTILFSAFRHHVHNPNPSARSIWALRLGSGERTWLLDNASQARYANDHLLFMREGDLMAVPFDVSKLEIAGSPRELKSNVLHALNTENDSWETAVGHYDVAPNGTLIYAAAGSNKQLPRTVAWVDRSGVSTPIEIDPRYYNSARVSPDGSSLLLWEWGTNKDDGAIWTLDLKRGGTRRELGMASYLWFAWGPESNQITGGRYTETDSELIAARAGADSGQPTVLPFSRPFHYVSEWSRDGQLLVCVGGNAIWLCPRGKVCQQIPKREDVVEQYPAISPDGRWLAFASNESSRTQVYVRSLTDLESIQQVSFTGGEQPVWSRDGSELYFCSLGGTKKSFYAVGIETAAKGSLSIGEPTLLFTLNGVETTVPVRNWDVAPDGRFVFTMVPAPELRSAFYKQRCPDRIHIVQNWPSKLDR